MFEQHPVPQNISSYQFRLVGDMTLKQFFQLGGGAVLALIIYALPLPALVKWPLIGIAAIGGAAFAFLPIQNRPLEVWLRAFLRSIYAPTVYFWDSTKQTMPYFLPDDSQAQPSVQLQSEAGGGQQIAHEPFINNLENNEKQYLTNITSLFKGHHQPKDQPSALPVLPQVQAIPVEPQAEKPLQAIPQNPPVSVPKTPVAMLSQAEPAQPTSFSQVQSQQLEETLTSTSPVQSQQAIFSPEAAPPIPPTQPNIVVGQVMNFEGKIIENAILEIKDNSNRSVRALKSNKAGHFQIVTPLPNGVYNIVIEKEGHTFEPVHLEIKGEILPPIAIKSVKPNG